MHVFIVFIVLFFPLRGVFTLMKKKKYLENKFKIFTHPIRFGRSLNYSWKKKKKNYVLICNFFFQLNVDELTTFFYTVHVYR